ncbi:MAG: hypothetical protein B7Y39_10235 [Bdellovibrio sp. 28-41-41]|nr:MAG: hypothetical protein B7Y39_10235 [Bdellovibrio sp. 28-41-41]
MTEEPIDFREEIYKSYGTFKGWESLSLPDSYFDIYAGEMDRHKVKPGSALLEIGFGSGHFLAWAKTQGYSCVGVEVNSDFVESAKTRGLEVFNLPLQKIADLKCSIERFDTVIIFDVLEHLYPYEILALFKALSARLNSGAKVICRFPNGLSPFATQTQWADLTHVTVLTPERMRQIGLVTGFEVADFDNSYRSLKVGKRSALAKKILYSLRNFYEIALGFFYFGGRVPLDPNLTLSLIKK